MKYTNIGVAFRNETTLHQLTIPKMPNQTPENEKSGVYNLTRNTSNRSYIGQTSHIYN